MNLKRLFNRTAEPKISVIITRETFIEGRPYTINEEVTLPEQVALQLIAIGAAVDPTTEGRAAAQAAKDAELLPPPVEALPCPEAWTKLPVCFASWWKLNEAHRCLADRRDAIEEKLIAYYRRYTLQCEPYELGTAIADPRERARVLGVAMSQISIGAIDPSHIHDCRLLRDFYQRAKVTTDEWLEANRDALNIARIECSNAVLKKHAELCHDSGALSAVAFDMFSIRIAALGLAEYEVRRLFTNSSDFCNYHRDKPSIQDLKSAWFEGNGADQHHYINQPVPVMVGMLEGFDAQHADIKALSKTAKSALDKTRTAIAA
ncbi:MAG: hypothetical protein V4819_01505 [Verrucomicrobiota bacterium]